MLPWDLARHLTAGEASAIPRFPVTLFLFFQLPPQGSGGGSSSLSRGFSQKLQVRLLNIPPISQRAEPQDLRLAG